MAASNGAWKSTAAPATAPAAAGVQTASFNQSGGSGTPAVNVASGIPTATAGTEAAKSTLRLSAMPVNDATHNSAASPLQPVSDPVQLSPVPPANNAGGSGTVVVTAKSSDVAKSSSGGAPSGEATLQWNSRYGQ
jgi:hypothetical protein